MEKKKGQNVAFMLIETPQEQTHRHITHHYKHTSLAPSFLSKVGQNSNNR